MNRAQFMAGALSLALGAGLSADDAKKPDAAEQPIARRFVGNLDNPSGVAIQPGTGHLFVAEHRGVVRFFEKEPGPDGKKARGRAMEVAKYATDIYGKGPMYDIGPLGVAFQDASHIVVGDGSRVDGEELVRIYEVNSTPAEKPAAEDSAKTTLGPIKAGEASAKGEGNFYGIAVTKDAIYVTCNGDDTKGWISRAEIKDGKVGELKPFIATKEKLGVDAPVGITVGPDGGLVVSQMGEMNVPGDSLLTIYDANSGELKAKFETGLHDIAGLAYSPATGKLYGVDFAWSDTKQGGLFELTISGDKCTTRKVVELDKPTAITFDDKGNAYVAVFGTAEEGATIKPGHVVRVPKGKL
jgi:DNA-binding beta-propeller fold protein YncE